MYVSPNFKTKKQLKEAIAANHHIEVFQPNDMFGSPGSPSVPQNGTVFLEGPHYPEPHKWYAKGTMKDGRLVKIS